MVKSAAPSCWLVVGCFPRGTAFLTMPPPSQLRETGCRRRPPSPGPGTFPAPTHSSTSGWLGSPSRFLIDHSAGCGHRVFDNDWWAASGDDSWIELPSSLSSNSRPSAYAPAGRAPQIELVARSTSRCGGRRTPTDRRQPSLNDDEVASRSAGGDLSASLTSGRLRRRPACRPGGRSRARSNRFDRTTTRRRPRR